MIILGSASLLLFCYNGYEKIDDIVCTLAGIEAVVICQGRPVPDDMKAAAEREGIGIITTPLSQFASAVALAELQPSAK